MRKKRKTIRLEPENEQYLRRIAWETDRSINWLLNDLVEKWRQRDSKVTASPCNGDAIQ